MTSPARLVLAREEPEHDKPTFAQASGVRKVDPTRSFEAAAPPKSTSSSNIPTRPMRVIKAPPQPMEPYVRNDTPAPLPVPCLRPTVVPDAGRYSFVDPATRRAR